MKKNISKKDSNYFKKAFTLLELVFVIVVVGIITSIAIGSGVEKNIREEASKLETAIRYTQHLAYQFHTYDKDDALWMERGYCIEFDNNSWSINRIDKNNKKIYAKDFIVKEENLEGELKGIELNVTLRNDRLCFSQFGEPYEGKVRFHSNNLLFHDVTFTLWNGKEAIDVIVTQKTGYVHHKIK